jgi:hypothetical protein
MYSLIPASYAPRGGECTPIQVLITLAYLGCNPEPLMLDIVIEPWLPLTPSGTLTVAWGHNPVLARAGLDRDCLLTELEIYP